MLLGALLPLQREILVPRWPPQSIFDRFQFPKSPPSNLKIIKKRCTVVEFQGFRVSSAAWFPVVSWNASWLALDSLLDSPEAFWRYVGPSRALLGHSWDALRRSWDPLGTLLARFRDVQGWILASPRRPQRYFKRILSNPSARKRTFRKSTESCPRTVREESENQIHQRCTASSAKKLLAGGLRAAN